MSTEEKWMSPIEQRKRWEGLYWATVLIWAGLILVLDNAGALPQVGEADAWSWIFFGAGAIGLLGNLYRAASPERLNPSAWDYIWSIFWLAVGLSSILVTDIFWPLVLLFVGGVMLFNSLRQGVPG